MSALLLDGPVDRSSTAIATPDRRLSWTEVDQALDRIVNRLLEVDLGPERRVGVFAENSPETLLAYVGAVLAGASVVPMSFHLTEAEVAYLLEDSGARLVLAGAETATRAAGAAHRVGAVPVAWGPVEPDLGVEDWYGWIDGASSEPPPTDHPPRPPFVYTSGTTGRPKGTELPPGVFPGGATIDEHVALAARNPLGRYGNHMVVGPLYHTGPNQGARLLMTGKAVSIPGRFDPEQVLATIERDRIETSIMVPTHFTRLLQLEASVRDRYDVSSLRRVSHTGAACPPEVKRAMIEWWGPVLVESYGGTEAGTICAITSEEWLEHVGSVGRTLPPFRPVVVDDEGDELAAGEVGRLYFSDATGRGVRFPNDPAKTAEVHLRPGVFTLGDAGYVDEDGYVFITDRFADMVVSGGVNLYPAEVEAVLVAHPDVDDVAVIGVPDEVMGERLHALVVPRGADLDVDRLLARCRQELAHVKCPRTIELVPSLDRSPMGKVDKRALRAPYWQTARTIGG